MAELVDAAKAGDLPRVRDCVLKRGCDVNFRCPPDGSTALYWSACGGHVLVCDWLVGHGADVDLATSKSGSTALHGASDRGRYECVYLLLKRGSHVDEQTTTNGDTALHLAAYRGHLDVCRLLIEHGADAALANKQRRTAFDEAKIKDHEAVCRLLLRHEALWRRKQEFRYGGKTYLSKSFNISESPDSTSVEDGSESGIDPDFVQLRTRPLSKNGHRRSAPLENSKTSPSPTTTKDPSSPYLLPPLDDDDDDDDELGPRRDGGKLRNLQLKVLGLESYVEGLEAKLRLRDRSVERLRSENAGLRAQLETAAAAAAAAAKTGTPSPAVQQELTALRRQVAVYAARAEEAGRELDAANRRYKQLQTVVFSVSQELKDFGPRDDDVT